METPENQNHWSTQAGRWEPGEHLSFLIDPKPSHQKLYPKKVANVLVELEVQG